MDILAEETVESDGEGGTDTENDTLEGAVNRSNGSNGSNGPNIQMPAPNYPLQAQPYLMRTDMAAEAHPPSRSDSQSSSPGRAWSPPTPTQIGQGLPGPGSHKRSSSAGSTESNGSVGWPVGGSHSGRDSEPTTPLRYGRGTLETASGDELGS